MYPFKSHEGCYFHDKAGIDECYCCQIFNTAKYIFTNVLNDASHEKAKYIFTNVLNDASHEKAYRFSRYI